MNLSLGLVGRTTMDRFGRVKRQPMDQTATSFIDGFTGFVGGYRKSRSDRSEVKQSSMQQQADHVVSATNLVEWCAAAGPLLSVLC